MAGYELYYSIFIIHDMVYNTLSLSSADYVEVIVCMLPPIVVYNNVYFLLGTTGQLVPVLPTSPHVGCCHDLTLGSDVIRCLVILGPVWSNYLK